MTLFRLGYVAMSVHVKNASPSQTMTYRRFEQLADREAAVTKLEQIAKSNLSNTLRLLKHNLAHDITFFRLSSKLVPLATHEELKDWNYISALKTELEALGDFALQHQMRIDFHPDHFVVLNSTDKEILKNSIYVLKYHYLLLKTMGIDPTHRCVIHLGGKYDNKDAALERFIQNWALVPSKIQSMIMLENDDKTFNLHDVLYICEKLNIPMVFDYHHHLANHIHKQDWIENWTRILSTWNFSNMPIKMHISSPKDENEFRSHAKFIDLNMFLDFVKEVKDTTEQIDCMVEAKQKDQALLKLVHDLKSVPTIKMKNQSSFTIE